MNFSDETLMAYVDGELDGATRAQVDAAQASDPALAARIARHRSLRTRLAAEFDRVLDEPLPERLVSATRAGVAAPRTDNVIPLRRRSAAAPRRSWVQWGAMAASLVLGILLGPLLLRPAAAPLGTRDGQVLATGALSQALSQQLASRQPAAARVQIGVSFRARSGDYCRSFTWRNGNALAGVACREGGRWRVEALAATTPAPVSAGGYRPAATALPPAVTRAVDDLISGEPLDAKEEAAARGRGWGR